MYEQINDPNGLDVSFQIALILGPSWVLWMLSNSLRPELR